MAPEHNGVDLWELTRPPRSPAVSEERLLQQRNGAGPMIAWEARDRAVSPWASATVRRSDGAERRFSPFLGGAAVVRPGNHGDPWLVLP